MRNSGKVKHNKMKGMISLILVLLMVLTMVVPGNFGVFADGISTETATSSDAGSTDNSEAGSFHSTDPEVRKILKVYPDENDRKTVIKLDGIMPESAVATVVDITDIPEEATLSDAYEDSLNAMDEKEAELSGERVAAYDITITDGDDEQYQPSEEKPIQVQIEDSRISEGENVRLLHIPDEGEVEEITEFELSDGKIIFEAKAFSVYEIVEVDAGETEPDPSTEDPCGLDGATFGLVIPMAGTKAAAMMSVNGSNQNRRKAQETKVEYNMLVDDNVIIAKDSNNNSINITMWTFEMVPNTGSYYITAMDGTAKKYLSINGSNVTMKDTPDTTCELTVTKGTDSQKGMVRIKNGSGYYLHLDSGSVNNGFGAAKNPAAANSWFNLVKESELTDNDAKKYSAHKISVSDTVNMHNGQKVIMYTRIWDETKKKYNFFIVNPMGKLVSAYEDGNLLWWNGLNINNLLWEFTEYYHEESGNPNYYYELQNVYSKNYIAPQFKDKQAFSDNIIGINLNGRRDGDYASTILAWDDTYYQYAGLRIEKIDGENKLVSCTKAEAQEFYFAVLEEDYTTDRLTTVDTIDNNEYGISMKMYNFNDVSGDRSTKMQDILKTNYNSKGSTLDILKPWLEDDGQDKGYPMSNKSSKSLHELYTSASPVNHLFLQNTYNESGYFQYNSIENFASLDTHTGNFTVYDQVGTIDGSTGASRKHGQFMPYNTIKAGEISSLKETTTDELGQTMDDSDPRKGKTLYKIHENADYFFVMELDARFTQTVDGTDAWGHDMIFEFTGDDDFWLYVDGFLVIDLGGIHGAWPGSVNFRTGEVKMVNDNGQAVNTTIYDLYKKAYKEKNSITDDNDPGLTEFLQKTFVEKNRNKVFKNYSPHTMKVFYMERGAGSSNLRMKFNLSSVKPGEVKLTKEVSGSDDLDYRLVQYPFQIFYKLSDEGEYQTLSNTDEDVHVYYPKSTTSGSGSASSGSTTSYETPEYVASYSPPNSSDVYKDVFFLNASDSVYIKFPDNTIDYYIKECGVHSQVYDRVKCNEDVLSPLTTATSDSYRHDFASTPATVDERPTVVFNNQVSDSALRSIFINKRLIQYETEDKNNEIEINAEQDPTEFSFRLYLDSENATGDLEPANMHKYYLKGPNGEYYKRDAANASFVTTGKTELSAITDPNELWLATFYTSPYGAISKIKSGYTIEVADIPVGTKFKIEERKNEIPEGYSLARYDREPEVGYSGDWGTGQNAGNGTNYGYVRPNAVPSISVVNISGYGLTAKKEWSDEVFTDDHQDVYVAVYLVNSSTGEKTLYEDSVRRITKDNSEVHWFFDELEEGYTFDNYEVYEVKLNGDNITEDSNGVVSGYTGAPEILEDGAKQRLSATPKGSDQDAEFDYTVDYSRGTPKGSGEVKNIKTDVVRNNRDKGVRIRLGKWNGTDPARNIESPLEGATFKLTFTNESGEVKDLGSLTSDENGIVTVVYPEDGLKGKRNYYTLTQTQSLKDYTGMADPIIFYIDDNDNVVLRNAMDDGWVNKTVPDSSEFAADINVYNLKYTLSAIKYGENKTQPLNGAWFELYAQKQAGSALVKDVQPMDGYDSSVLRTGSDGVIPKIDKTLNRGTYYLTEYKSPSGYTKVSEDIVFSINELGKVSIDNPVTGVGVSFVDTEDSGEYYRNYKLEIIDRRVDAQDVTLKVSKKVKGLGGNKAKDFEFTFNVTGMDGISFNWKKNNVSQPPLASGETFTLSHGDEAVFTVPSGSKVTITENAESYTTSFAIDNVSVEGPSPQSATITVNDNSELQVTNSRGMPVPTGVRLSVIALIISLIFIIVSIALLIRRRREYQN